MSKEIENGNSRYLYGQKQDKHIHEYRNKTEEVNRSETTAL